MSDDEQVKKDVVDQLYWDTSVDASKTKVEVADGKVTLSGTVSSYPARRAAHTDALVVPGVTSVDNQLVVELPPALPLPDDELEERIVRVLEWSTGVEPEDTRVSVNGGWVTLEGSVDAYWKKAGAEELVSDLIGVVTVANQLAVVPTESVVDKAIADDVVSALERNAAVDARSINVEVENGVVILSGVVPNASAVREALGSARYTAGALDVVNKLRIGEG